MQHRGESDKRADRDGDELLSELHVTQTGVPVVFAQRQKPQVVACCNGLAVTGLGPLCLTLAAVLWSVPGRPQRRGGSAA